MKQTTDGQSFKSSLSCSKFIPWSLSTPDPYLKLYKSHKIKSEKKDTGERKMLASTGGITAQSLRVSTNPYSMPKVSSDSLS